MGGNGTGTRERFAGLIMQVTDAIAGRPVEPALADFLDARFPAGGATFEAIRAACHQAIEEGWMCSREAGGIRFGRVIPAGEDTAGFSVDVVRMEEVVGPHHRHPRGEIDMIMPIDPEARFDGRGAGWLVYGPDSAHRPTVTGGAALILYLLPGGEIEFTR
ncbi:DUF4863 family protein [Inmirania thermothiophila]|uniref:Uncharacterized protein DUF4863 n=1 Tax=Inmirania thermothiophila TaxID=1750597 RepID=A0A3N1Y4F3_9GAMM|nr:DUF4863 family protein [Inmirania thermothiophila]ROR32472.1 uncharacterized protein DUF4863 [Inmirania thermothiophila]